MPEPREVRSMFARIAGRYDLLNRTLSAGVDRRWRQRTVERAGAVRGCTVIDTCCGTGELAYAFARRGARVIGADFTPQMLARAERKRREGRPDPLFVEGDALRLPVASGVAEVCCVAFGIRNVADRVQALREMQRVLRPGGLALILEFTTPPGRLVGGAYRTYFTRVLPIVGRVVSGDAEAYGYLPRSVLAWPSPPELEREMRAAGMIACGHELLTRGIACLHWGHTPARATAMERES